MIYEIPIAGGSPFISFNVQLEDLSAKIFLNWSYNGGFYRVDIHINGEPVVLGKGLNPNTDLLKTLKLGIGRLYLHGESATINNLGVANRLIYEPLQQTV